VNEHIICHGILNVTILGGLTQYVQAGNLGIYKLFKGKASPIIAACDQVWKQHLEILRLNLIENSVRAKGFGDCHESIFRYFGLTMKLQETMKHNFHNMKKI
jgi:hypothetical protein